MLAMAISLNRLPGLPAKTSGVAPRLVAGNATAASLIAGAAAGQLRGTCIPPIEAARPKPAVTAVLPPLGPTPDETVDPDAPAQPNPRPPAPVAGARPPAPEPVAPPLRAPVSPFVAVPIANEVVPMAVS